jgi:hypothetical protein
LPRPASREPGAGGDRIIEGDRVYSGTVSLLAGALLELGGDYSQNGNGTFKTFIDGTTSFGKFTVTGLARSAAIDGTLEIVTDAGFGPQDGQSFQILTAPTRAGRFQTINGRLLPCPFPLAYRVGYAAQTITLTLKSSLFCS